MKCLLFACSLLLAIHAHSQQYLEPSLGYSVDLSKSSFRQISTAVQLAYKGKNPGEVIVRLQAGIPLTTVSSDPAFSANPAVPLQATAEKRIVPFSIAASAGGRIRLAGGKSNNLFFLVPMAGLKFERIGVRYQYDKSNYTILNPDKSLSRFGLFGSLSAEYMHLLKEGRIFTALQVATPPVWGTRTHYPSSFHFLVPLSLQVGYSIYLSKN